MNRIGHPGITRPGASRRRSAAGATRLLFGGRRARPVVALLGAVVLALSTSGCGGDDADTADTGVSADATAENTDPTTAGGEDTEDGGRGDAGTTAPEEGEEPTPGSAGGTAPEDTTRPYVVNFYGEENADGAAEREPANLVLSEHSSLQDVEWSEWNGDRAVGTGRLSGMWCLPDCADQPFDATVTLSEPTDVDGDLYFAAFDLEAPAAEEYRADDLDGERPLQLP
ncbi:hypothetical protein [Streptomyces lonarensis]|uniref:Uncharacterized protein n=1 Tax=Streptomyces lonarensis TaxID=700599 RepID=A0A7X6D044_9ACTN|nr:hypothetical protein [Streptomyces lonarensis]NJQ05727.1 hypothetical protein [Streptomyces lonarensis]